MKFKDPLIIFFGEDVDYSFLKLGLYSVIECSTMYEFHKGIFKTFLAWDMFKMVSINQGDF